MFIKLCVWHIEGNILYESGCCLLLLHVSECKTAEGLDTGGQRTQTSDVSSAHFEALWAAAGDTEDVLTEDRLT